MNRASASSFSSKYSGLGLVRVKLTRSRTLAGAWLPWTQSRPNVVTRAKAPLLLTLCGDSLCVSPRAAPAKAVWEKREWPRLVTSALRHRGHQAHGLGWPPIDLREGQLFFTFVFEDLKICQYFFDFVFVNIIDWEDWADFIITDVMNGDTNLKPSHLGLV